jgi:hypothetical protein
MTAPQLEEKVKKRLQPAWSGERVRQPIRWLAGLFVLFGVVAVFLVVRVLVNEPVLTIGMWLKVLMIFLGEIYLMSVFLHVVIYGKAPDGWIPFRTLKNYD